MELYKVINGIQHLGIPAVDVKKAVRFYEQKLGFHFLCQKLVMDVKDGALEAAFVQLGNMVLELYKPMHCENEIASRGAGVLDHFAIDSPDFADCARAAAAKGLQLHASTPDGCVLYEHIGEKGVRGINFAGPNGEVIELCHDYSRQYGNKKGLQGWSHLALKVRSLQCSIAFYEKMGFRKCADGYIDTPQGRLNIGFVELQGFQLELIESLPFENSAPGGRGHIDHMALDVTDVSLALSICQKQRYRILTPVVKELSLFERGVKYIMIAGPDGEVIELNQKL